MAGNHIPHPRTRTCGAQRHFFCLPYAAVWHTFIASGDFHPPARGRVGRGGTLLLAVRGCLVLLLTGGSLISPARVRVGRGGLLLLPVRGRLVHLRGQRQPSSDSVSPRTRVRGTRRHFFSGRPLAAWPTCVAGGETPPTHDDVNGGAAVYLLTVRDHPPRA